MIKLEQKILIHKRRGGIVIPRDIVIGPANWKQKRPSRKADRKSWRARHFHARSRKMESRGSNSSALVARIDFRGRRCMRILDAAFTFPSPGSRAPGARLIVEEVGPTPRLDRQIERGSILSRSVKVEEVSRC